MNSHEKNKPATRAARGIAIGFAFFALLAAVSLFTPLRKPLLAVAGRDTPALEYRLRAQRDTLDALQRRASDARLSNAERATLEQAQNGYVATRERIDARQRMNARLTALGLVDAIRELFPWLLAFGLAFPVLGGLIGAQVRTQRVSSAAAPRPRADLSDSENPPSVPLDRPHAPPPPPPRPVLKPARPYVHPATAAAAAAATVPAPAARPIDSVVPPAPVAQRPLPGSPVILPRDIVAPPPAAPSVARNEAASDKSPEPPSEEWGFRHQPTPLESRPRPKLPPVRSPHSLDEPEDTEGPLAG